MVSQTQYLNVLADQSTRIKMDYSADVYVTSSDKVGVGFTFTCFQLDCFWQR